LISTPSAATAGVDSKSARAAKIPSREAYWSLVLYLMHGRRRGFRIAKNQFQKIFVGVRMNRRRSPSCGNSIRE